MNVFDVPELRAWLDDVERAGNRVDDARLLFKYPRDAPRPFACVLWADVWVESEGRHKANEFVFSRADVGAVAVVDESRERVLMVREFRTPCRSRDGKVTELPGGSVDEGEDPASAALRELAEETGIELPFVPLVASTARWNASRSRRRSTWRLSSFGRGRPAGST